LFAKRPKVTNARGGQSNHNFGIAWDVGIFENGKYYAGDTQKEDKAYVELGGFIKANVPGLEWGGDWKGFVDKPHYQLATGKSVVQVRALLEKREALRLNAAPTKRLNYETIFIRGGSLSFTTSTIRLMIDRDEAFASYGFENTELNVMMETEQPISSAAAAWGPFSSTRATARSARPI